MKLLQVGRHTKQKGGLGVSHYFEELNVKLQWLYAQIAMQMILLTLHPELFLGGFISFCLFHKIGKLAITSSMCNCSGS
jgi:hypothetical protein